MRSKRKAFTLVELLVVIGIIALLISILLPSLFKARKAARTAACLSNLHQMILAFNMYAVNNKGSTIPETYINGNCSGDPNITSATSSGIPWLDKLAPYMAAGGTGQAATKYMFCPEAPQATGVPGINVGGVSGLVGTATNPYSQPASSSYPNGFAGTYGMNISVTSVSPWVGYYPPFTATAGPPYDIPPATVQYYWTKIAMAPNNNVPVFFDCTWCDLVGINVEYTSATAWSVLPPPTNFVTGGTDNIQRACLNRHSGAVNVAFKDGSASSVRLKSLWDLQWNRLSTPQSQTLTGTFPAN